MTQPTITVEQELYYRLRNIHIQHGNIVVAAEQRARHGDYTGAVAWLNTAEDSDFVADKPALKAATARMRRAIVTPADAAVSEITTLLTHLAATFGTTVSAPDQVADRIRSYGIKGTRGDSRACPLANLLSALTGAGGVEVFEDHVQVWAPQTEGDPVQVGLPGPIAAFVSRFNAGLYLDLVGRHTPAVA